MAAILPADVVSREWNLVLDYAKARIEELTAICISTGATDEDRRMAANRIEELTDLINAPKRTKGATEHRRVYQPTEMY